MPTPKEKMLEAQQRIRERDFAGARRILRTVDHPKAQEWLARLDEVDPQDDSPSMPSRGWADAAEREPRRQTPVRQSSPVIVEERSKLPFLGTLLLLVTAIAGGLAVGGLLYLSSLVVYIVLASVGLAGGLCAVLLMGVIKVGKVRDGVVVGFLGLMMGLLAYGTFRYMEYLAFRQDVRQMIYQEEPAADPQLVEAYIDDVLVQETGRPGLIGFWIYEAQQGLSLTLRSRYSSPDRGIPISLSPQLTVVYWIVEILITGGVAAVLAADAAGKPFCEETNRWLKFEKLRGHVPKESFPMFSEALQHEDFATAASLLEERRSMGLPRLLVEVGRCHKRSQEARLKITREDGRNSEVIMNSSVPIFVYDELVRHAPIRAR